MSPELPWWMDPMTVATIVIAGASVLYAVFSFLLWRVTARYTKTTDKAFEASHRAYVGVESMEVHKDVENRRLKIVARLKNFGSAPANHLQVTWDLVLDGTVLPKREQVYRPSVLLPTVAFLVQCEIAGEGYVNVADGRSTLEFSIGATYRGLEQREYKYSQKSRYNPQLRTFDAVEGEST